MAQTDTSQFRQRWETGWNRGSFPLQRSCNKRRGSLFFSSVSAICHRRNPASAGEVIPESTLAARLALEEAAHLDPRSLRAWSQLATCYISDYKNRWNEAGKEEVGAGQDLVRRAREALAGKLTRLTRTWLSPGMPKALSAASREGIKKDTRRWIGPLGLTRTSPRRMRKSQSTSPPGKCQGGAADCTSCDRSRWSL